MSLNRQQRAGLVALLWVPIVLFYALLSRTLTNLPFYDDYDSVLDFLYKYKHEHGVQRLLETLTHQHNEYRLVFQNAIYVINYLIVGHASMKVLSVAGDLLVLPLFGMLYLLWKQFHLNQAYALIAFVPVSWILFQLQYASTLNCVMAPLQNVAVLFFILAAFYLAAQPGRTAFGAAMLSLVLAIASSGNGLFVAPILALLFLQRREWVRLVATFLISSLTTVLYFYGGYFHQADDSTKAAGSFLSRFSLTYAAAFLGSIAAKTNPVSAILLAGLMVIVFGFATRDRLYLRNPALYYSTLFFFFQGIAVSCIRSQRGLSSALGSRYRINSALLFILLYLYLADRLSGITWSRTVKLVGTVAACLLLLGFNLLSDRTGNRLLTTRRDKVQAGIYRWERHQPKPPIGVQDPADFTAENDKLGLYEPIEPTLSDAIREGIYSLPPEGKNR